MTYQEPWFVSARYVTNAFVEAIAEYGEPNEYTVLFNCKTGRDVICRHRAARWQDKKTNKWYSRDEWMPEMTIVHPTKNRLWYCPPVSYWLNKLRRTDVRRNGKHLKKVYADMLRAGDAFEENRETYDDDYTEKRAIDRVRSYYRKTLTMPENSGWLKHAKS